MRLKLIIFITFAFSISSVFAQEACNDIIHTAFESTTALCRATARDQACYGAGTVDAEVYAGTLSAAFAEPGALIDLVALASIETQISGAYGVGVMRVQANLPDALRADNVTLVLFGDAQMTNRGATQREPVVLIGSPTTNANVREQPAESAAIAGSYIAYSEVRVVGRANDNIWLLVELPNDRPGTGWMLADLLIIDGDIQTLTVVDPNVPQYGPMQAFSFTSGIDDAPCEGAPASGILMQSPQNAGRVIMSINEVSIRLDSTVFLQAQPGGEMIINLLEGSALVEASNGITFVPAGTRLRIAMTEDLRPTGDAPIGPEPYSVASLAGLPLELLERAIIAATPLTPPQIEELQTTDALQPTSISAPAGLSYTVWTNHAYLISDTCGGAATQATFPVSLGFDAGGDLAQLQWFSTAVSMTKVDDSYRGSETVGDATYSYQLTFTSGDSYTAEEIVTFAYSPDCQWLFRWEGVKEA